MSSPSLSSLPAVSFAPLDAQDVEQEIITTYERIAETSLYPGDPVRLLLESLAYTISIQSGLIDLAAKQNLLAFATGAHLDHLGALMGTPRLEASSARATFRFSIGQTLAFPVLIPAGTRVCTADRSVTFATGSSAEIVAGALSVSVAGTADTAGTEANGLVPGQVSSLVDPLPYITAARNETLTLGGADVETDAHYRARIQLAPEAYTCAGPEGSYRYHVLAVHRDIAEVAVWSPKPGHVDIRPVLSGGVLPSEELLAEIAARVSAEDVRPLTDTVTVAAPEGVAFSVRGGWYLRQSDSALSGSISAAVASALENYRLWQRGRPGRDINPDELIHRLKAAGAKRIVLTEPAFTKLEPWQIARDDVLSLEYLGIEDE